MNNTRKHTQLDYCDRLEHRPFSAVSPVHPAHLVLRPATHRSNASPHRSEAPLLHWLQSGSNLDFMVLALCSCVLSVLCHQTTMLSTPTVDSVPASAIQPATVDFAVKAALFTTSKSQDAEEDLRDF